MEILQMPIANVMLDANRKITLNARRQVILGPPGSRCCCGGAACACGPAFAVYRWQCDPVQAVPVQGERRFGAVVYEIFELLQLQAHTVQVGRFADTSRDYTYAATEVIFGVVRARVCIGRDGVLVMPGSQGSYTRRVVAVYNGEEQIDEQHREWGPDDWGPPWSVFDFFSGGNGGTICNSIATVADSVTLNGLGTTVGLDLPPGPCNVTSDFRDSYDRSVCDVVDRGSTVFGGEAALQDGDQAGTARAYHTYSGQALFSAPTVTETVNEYAISTHIASWGRELRCPADPPLTGGRLALLAGRASGRSSVEGCVGCGDGGA